MGKGRFVSVLNTNQLYAIMAVNLLCNGKFQREKLKCHTLENISIGYLKLAIHGFRDSDPVRKCTVFTMISENFE